MTLESKFLLCLNEKKNYFKNKPFNYGFSLATDTLLWDYLYHKDGYRQKLQCIHCNSVLISYTLVTY